MTKLHKPVCAVCGEPWPCELNGSQEHLEECHLCGNAFHWKDMRQDAMHPLLWECRKCRKEMGAA